MIWAVSTVTSTEFSLGTVACCKIWLGQTTRTHQSLLAPAGCWISFVNPGSSYTKSGHIRSTPRYNGCWSLPLFVNCKKKKITWISCSIKPEWLPLTLENKLVCVRSLNFSILFQCEHPKLQIGLFVQGVYCGSMMSLNILWIMLEKGVSSTGEDRTIFLKLEEGGGTQKKMGNWVKYSALQHELHTRWDTWYMSIWLMQRGINKWNAWPNLACPSNPPHHTHFHIHKH